MTTERITVTAADLQPGDVLVERGGHEIRPQRIVQRALPFVSVNGHHVPADTEYTVDRPVPTTTLAFDVPEEKREAVEAAVHRILSYDKPTVKMGDRVVRTAEAHFGQGWQHDRGATGRVIALTPPGGVWVLVDGDGSVRRTWRPGSFAVVPS